MNPEVPRMTAMTCVGEVGSAVPASSISQRKSGHREATVIFSEKFQPPLAPGAGDADGYSEPNVISYVALYVGCSAAAANADDGSFSSAASPSAGWTA
jgi:hypothetical protein